MTFFRKNNHGKNIQIKQNVDEQQVVFWSADYAKRATAERQPTIDKEKDLIGNIQKYNKKIFGNRISIACCLLFKI